MTGTATYSATPGAVWDTSTWDNAFWQAGTNVVKQWASPAEWEGFSAAGKLKIVTNTVTVQWLANDYIWEAGSIF